MDIYGEWCTSMAGGALVLWRVLAHLWRTYRGLSIGWCMLTRESMDTTKKVVNNKDSTTKKVVNKIVQKKGWEQKTRVGRYHNKGFFGGEVESVEEGFRNTWHCFF